MTINASSRAIEKKKKAIQSIFIMIEAMKDFAHFQVTHAGHPTGVTVNSVTVVISLANKFVR
jgi:hypothetical protein